MAFIPSSVRAGLRIACLVLTIIFAAAAVAQAADPVKATATAPATKQAKAAPAKTIYLGKPQFVGACTKQLWKYASDHKVNEQDYVTAHYDWIKQCATQLEAKQKTSPTPSTKGVAKKPAKK